MPEPSTMRTEDPANAELRLFAPPHTVAPDVWLHAAFVNTYALRTGDGLVLIDPGLGHQSGAVRDALRRWDDAPLRTAIYTHGHADHAFGLRAFLEAGERPRIVAQENCPARFRRYQLTHGWNARINQRQFALPAPIFPDRFDWPDVTFRDALEIGHGDVTLRLHAARGETDDHCWIHVPERGLLFTGDLVIWNAPNCGNPQKVQRYPVDWAEALERMAACEAEWLLPGHGLVVHGRDAVRLLLLETARYLRVLIDQVLERMNRGETPEAIYHAVEPDPELARRPYLRPLYDHPKFIVRNLLRLWGGWWNGNAAELLPAPPDAQAREVAGLAGGVGALVARGEALLAAGDTVLAAHLAEWATRAEPADGAAQTLKRRVYERRMEEEPSLMGRGIYRAAANDARLVLGEEPLPAQARPVLGPDGTAR